MTITVDIGDVNSVAADLSRDLQSLSFRETLQEIAVELREIHYGYFERGAGPSGIQWPDWYFRQRGVPNNHPNMVVSGHLRDSLVSGPNHIEQVGDRDLTFGTSVPYAYKHQEGGVFEVDNALIGRDGRGRKNPGDTIKLPQREFMGIDSETLDRFAGMVADHIVQSIRNE